jgi:hypothetical protein
VIREPMSAGRRRSQNGFMTNGGLKTRTYPI